VIAHQSMLSKKNRLTITCSVMAATVMQVLDSSIVNVALPTMQGTFSAAPDQISWVLTCYLISAAIFMPLTGYLSGHFGRRKHLLFSIFGFTMTSALCGVALNLDQMIFFRLCQGICGAALVPLSQAILLDIYPQEEHGKAMAIWGTGVMIGPILGPSLGGYLTEMFHWRWTFYINIPIGIASLFAIVHVLPDTPKVSRRLDGYGLVAMAMAIGGLQYALDRGNQRDWFEALDIKISTLMSFSGFSAYLLLGRLRKHTKPLFNIAIFKNRNFVASCVMMLMAGFGLFGASLIQSLMLQNLLNYSAYLAGLSMAPRGFASMVGMFIVGQCSKYGLDYRLFILIGILLNILGCSIGTQYFPGINLGWVMLPGLLQGLGLGLIMIPLATLALSTLPPSLSTEGAGFYGLMRTLGSSIGISSVMTLLTRHIQSAWYHLSGFIHPYNPALYTYVQGLGLEPTDPLSMALVGQTVAAESMMMAVLDTFHAMMWGFMLMIPMVMLLEAPMRRSRPSTEHSFH
jgi:MFS transporter, DHA2 family, multidrug resistance protein